MKRINEIFYSLQGEGLNSGTAAVFVRFSGCNLHCPFCDTDHIEGKDMTDDEIVCEVSKYPGKLVVLTGGEPAIQIDGEFLKRLKDTGKTVAVETNGTIPLPEGIDFITLSPKFQFCEGAEIKVSRCDELKVVFTGVDDISVYGSIETENRFLQPCNTGDAERDRVITMEAIEYCKRHPEWRLSLQTQKILKIR